MVAQTIKEFGQVDILVNNAARGTFNNADVADMSLDEWHDSLAINLTGAMLCCKEVLKDMIPRRSGNIVNVSSVAGISGRAQGKPLRRQQVGLNRLHRDPGYRSRQAQHPRQLHQPRGNPDQEFEDWVKTSAKTLRHLLRAR